MSDNITELNVKLKKLLSEKDPVITLFPPCTDILLSLMVKIQLDHNPKNTTMADIFQEYFTIGKHKIFSDKEWRGLYARLFACADTDSQLPSQDILDDCLAPGCKMLEGNRRLKDYGPLPGGLTGIRRLFIADLYWMYFMENMGINMMSKIILKDYEYEGYYPIPNNSLASVVMEVMTRETRKGVISTFSDRYYNYTRTISNYPRMLHEFSYYWLPFQSKEEIISLTDKYLVDRLNRSLLDVPLGRFFKTVLSYYRDRKVTKAIGRSRSPPVDISSIVSIMSLIGTMKEGFKTFNFGRVYYNTLSMIIWFMAGLSLLWEIRKFLGISYEDFYQFLSASYDIVHQGEFAHTVTASNTTYFKLNHTCANSIRSILMDLEVLDFNNMSEVETWLDLVEDKFESFRIAYLQLTGDDVAVNEYLLTNPSERITWPGWHPATEAVSIARKTSTEFIGSPLYRSKGPESLRALGEFESPSVKLSRREFESPSVKMSPSEYRSVKLQSDEE